jgi:hypothetical protein
MVSNISAAGPAGRVEKEVPSDARRFRFSLSTRNAHRWLLVQVVVSVPAGEAGERALSAHIRSRQHKSVQRLLSDYCLLRSVGLWSGPAGPPESIRP